MEKSYFSDLKSLSLYSDKVSPLFTENPKKRSSLRFSFIRKMNFSFGLEPSTLAKKIYGKSYAEAEEFAMSVYRKCVLNGFETKPRQITNEQLKLFGYQTEE